MRVHVLGSGAGGGFPQWNCNCVNCRGYRSGELKASARTQSSIVVSADDDRWILVNASPDIRAQFAAFPELQPGRELRDSAVVGVVLIDSQIDHTTGLLSLREGRRLDLHCTPMVRQDLSTGFPLLPMLEHYCGVDCHEVPLDGESFGVNGAPGLRLTAIALSSKAPPYSPHRHDPHPGDNIGLFIEHGPSALFYAPGLGRVESHLLPWMKRADCLLVDGTFWTEDEMIRRGVGTKPAASMGHLPQSGPGGMIEQLRPFADRRRILIHINNTNPILDEDSAERRALEAENIEVAFDGMDIRI